jgi:para-nitrobenzyl esterase
VNAIALSACPQTSDGPPPASRRGAARRCLLPLLVLVAAIHLLSTTAQPAATSGRPSPSVRTESGLVTGVTTSDGAVRSYKGIPYAAPPVAALRWKPPQPASSWPGSKAATEFAAACPQAERTGLFGERIPKTNEDCLYLNVWAPVMGGGRRAPVLVWIHGGGFTQGSASIGVYDGEALARRGLVVVTVNYRLGPFGFLAHPQLTKESGHDASGNYGLLDQLAALRWVKANIRAFGGNPDRVTVMGESAGAVSVGCLLVSPQARGLFQRAIIQSGSPYGVTRYLHDAPAGEESMEEVGELVARRLGCDREDDVVGALRARTVDEIMEAARPAPVFFGEGIRFGPVVDRWLIPDRPATLLAARKPLRVPVLIGSNGDEGTIFVAPLQGFDVEAYRRFVRATFRDRADEVLARFPVARDSEVKAALARLVGYSAFVAPSRRMARALAAVGDQVYLYSFTHVREGAVAARLGAFHGSEIPFVFGTLSRVARAESDDADRDLSRAMMGYWAQFAASGNPNGGDAPVWPRYLPSTDLLLEFSDDIASRPVAARELCDFFDRIAAERTPAPAPKAPGR